MHRSRQHADGVGGVGARTDGDVDERACHQPVPLVVSGAHLRASPSVGDGVEHVDGELLGVQALVRSQLGRDALVKKAFVEK